MERAADIVADVIAEAGIEHVFLLPGGGAMYLVDAVGKHADIEVVACLHEQAAAISAEAYGRIHQSGIGVAIVTTGPGATNAITAVAGAWIESVPLLIISGQVKRADMLRNSPLRQKGVQEVDIVSMVKSITKYAKTVEDANDIRLEMERAIHIAKEGRAGPVWLDIPLDIQATPVACENLRRFQVNEEQQQDKSRTESLDSAITQTLALIAKAERPLILAGHGVRLSGAADNFLRLIEHLGIPVVTTWNAMDLLPFEHPQCVGRPGVVALRAANFAVQNCDLLISIGSRLDHIITAYNPRDFARAAKKVVVDVDINEINKLDMEIAVPVCSDARIFISALQKLAPESAESSFDKYQDWRQRCRDWKKRYPVNDGLPFASDGAITHYHFSDALSQVTPENTLVSTGSSGLAVEIFYTVFRNKPGQRVFLTSGLGAMGYGLPAAIGACFANGRKPMLLVESDGSLQLNIQELATLKAFDLPICIIIMNNGGYCSIRNTQRNYFDGRYVGTGPEAGLRLPELMSIADTYGLAYAKISGAAQLESQMQSAMKLSWPMILEVELVHSETLAPKVAALPQPDGSMLSMPLEDMSPLLSLEKLQSEMLIPLTEQSLMARSKTSQS